MKRYFLSMALGVFAVGAIGAYYASGTEGEVPPYKLVTLEGDAAEASAMQLSGSYIGGVGSKPLELTVEGTKYRMTHSFYEKYLQDNRYLTTHYEDMKALKREHRDFMRARSNVNSFYKDAEWLIYADSVIYGPGNWRAELKVDVLEESTGHVSKHRIELDEAKRTDWIRVEDVQKIGDEIHILAQVRYRAALPAGGSDGTTMEFRDYVVDLRSGELLREDALISEKLAVSEGMQRTANAQPVTDEVSLTAITSEVRSQPSEYVVLMTARSHNTVVDEEGKRKTEFVRKQAAYSYRTGQLTPLPESTRDLEANAVVQSEIAGDRLTVLYSDNQSLTIARYNVATGLQERDELTITSEQLGERSIRSASLAQNRVYALLSPEDENKVGFADSRKLAAVVLDADGGKVLYKGEAAYAGPAEKAEEFRKNLLLTNVNGDRS